MLTFVAYGTPAPQGSKKGFYNPKLGRVQMMESSKKVKPWRQDVIAAALNALADQAEGIYPIAVPVELQVEFFLARPQAHYRTGQHAGQLKPTAPVYSDKYPDLDKLIRSTCDAMASAGVLRNDSQIVRHVAEKKYIGGDAPLAQPGAIITVVPLQLAVETAASSEQATLL